MPEIGEVARTVHYIKKLLVGKTLAKVTAVEDGNVFGKVGTSHTEIMKNLTGKRVVDAGQQGKYFWMIMSSPPHPVMHFGMAGWMKYKSEHTYYYRKKNEDEKEEWPPKYWKFMMETDGEGDEKVEAAFVDLRRFARVRLVDCPGKDIRKVTPLKENGPDPVADKDQVTVEWLTEKCHSKKVPIKAMLLDQANISGIGNWVGDEIMYDAKMHPEQYANTLSDEQIKQLHKSIHYVCGTAVDLLADSEQFPEDWLFKHRWGKGKKDAPKTLPNGEKIVFLTVGGRTSAVVPSIQKKTGPVAKEMSEAEEEEKPAKGKSKKRKAEDDEVEEEKPAPKKAAAATAKKGAKANGTSKLEEPVPKKVAGKRGVKVEKTVKDEEEEEETEVSKPKVKGKSKNTKAEKDTTEDEAPVEELPQASKPSSKKKPTKETTKVNGSTARTKAAAKTATKAAEVPAPVEDNGRRRSGRLR